MVKDLFLILFVMAYSSCDLLRPIEMVKKGRLLFECAYLNAKSIDGTLNLSSSSATIPNCNFIYILVTLSVTVHEI